VPKHGLQMINPPTRECTAQGRPRRLVAHACKMGLEDIVLKRKDSPYRSGQSPDWLKMKNPNAPAVKREAEEDGGR
jgi:ATP-dependent DNA ligase